MLRPAVLALAVTAACTAPPPPAPVSHRADFEALLGGGWAGTLTYRDYSPPHGDVTLPVAASLTATGDGVRIAWSYPTEPHANAADDVVLGDGGRTIDGAPVAARTVRGDTVELTTRAPGQDDDRPATIEHVYSLSPHRLAIRKSVQFGTAAPIRRNEYVLTR